MFKPVESKVDFPKMEENILSFWEKNEIFKRSLDQTKGSKPFIFYDGPPFATGLPHFGHLVPSTLKDIIPRYKSMQGFYVSRRWGWDTHGLPVEYEVEKSLGLKTKQDILDMGIASFNDNCQNIVLKYSGQWKETISRLGRWVDFENRYTTMDSSFMESVWWVFGELYKKGLIYQGYYILPYSPKLETPLSNFEVSLGEYKDVHDPALTIKFPLKDKPHVSFIAWTTTPWTLPTNLSLAVNGKNTYVHIKTKETKEEFILVKERVSAFFEENSFELLDSFLGETLKDVSYIPPFSYYENEREKGAFKVCLTDYVTNEDGTGIMHVAPFGEEDFNLLKKNTSVDIPCPIDETCSFTAEIPEFKGLFVKDADKGITKLLSEEGKVFKKEIILHRYPHCYRTGAPLIYRPIASWFVKVESIKDKMIANNQKVTWHPDHLQKGRFGKWLEGARDWVISRNRFWGNPIPVWQCDVTGEKICISSFEELEKLSGQKLKNYHRPYIDDVTWPSPAGGTYHRVKEVLDCWFESGSMPYGQVHYPFEDKDTFNQSFPANFIAEGLDQTRGWFYTLMILSTALFDKPAFENVIVNGLVLASDGKKMSKSLRNYTDPREIIDSYGADALRLYLVNSSVVKAEDLKFSDEGVKDVLKNILIPLWSAYSFFTMYASIDKYEPRDIQNTPLNPLDAWILSEIETLNKILIEKMDSYNITESVHKIVYFIDILNNWYIRRSRRRFWRSENDQDKLQAYDTLYYVIKKLITLSSPFIPFMTEEIYQNLKTKEDPSSVHLCSYPKVREEFINNDLEDKMALIQKAVKMGRTLRNALNIKNRQPLRRLHIITRNEKEQTTLREMEDIVLEELNVKEIFFKDNEEDIVEYKAKANFKVLGKKLGNKMKPFADKIKELSSSSISSLLEGSSLALEVDSELLNLEIDDIIVEREEKSNLKVLNEGSLTIAFDTEIPRNLYLEGMVRDLIRLIQNTRKEIGLEVQDKINLYLKGDSEWEEAIEEFKDLIQSETLSVSLSIEKVADSKNLPLEGEIWLSLKKEG